MSIPNNYRDLIAIGRKPQRTVVAQLTSPDSGYGHMPWPDSSHAINALREEFAGVDGIMG